MTRFFLAGAMALGLMSSAAFAQSSSSQTTTITTAPAVPSPPAIIVPPPGTLSTSTTEVKVGADGTRTESSGTTYRNSAGVAEDSVTKTTVMPAAPVTTSTSTSTTVTKP